jgi:hypothetical protein
VQIKETFKNYVEITKWLQFTSHWVLVCYPWLREFVCIVVNNFSICKNILKLWTELIKTGDEVVLEFWSITNVLYRLTAPQNWIFAYIDVEFRKYNGNLLFEVVNFLKIARLSGLSQSESRIISCVLLCQKICKTKNTKKIEKFEFLYVM